MWAVEHGPMGGDELNLLAAGENYGWPLATYGRNYDGSRVSPNVRVPGTQPPVWYWVPSIGPGGITFYDGDVFPHWRGDLFVAAMRKMRLERFEMDGDQVIGRELLLESIGERVRDVHSGPEGYLYVVLDNDPGRIIRLEPASQSVR
jgi:glucose/arabinose dehydrogenase